MSIPNLTSTQLAHVAKVFPESRSAMARYLADGVKVDFVQQREVGEAPAYAIYVCSDPDFWIDCCPSVEEAQELSKSLGLSLSPN